MAGISLDELLNQVSSFKTGADDATSKLLGISQAQQDIASSDASIYAQKATDDSTITAAKVAGQLETQNNIKKAGVDFGTDMGEVNQQVTKLALASQSAYTDKLTALAAIKEKQSTSFITDPIGFIMNKFTINSDIDKYNLAEETETAANKRIQAINTNTQTTVQTQNVLSQTMTQASAEAATRNAAVSALLESHKSTQQGLAYNAQGIQNALQTTQAGLSAEFQANSASNTERTIGISLQHLKLAQDNAVQARTEFEQRQQNLDDANTYAASTVDTINKGRQVRMGDAFVPLDPTQSKLIVASIKSKNPIGESLMADYSIGERSNIAGAPIIGTSPAQTIDLMSKTNVALTPSQQIIKENILGQAVSDLKNAQTPGSPAARSFPALANVSFKDKDAVTNALNQHAQDLLTQSAKVIKPGDATNPYQIASIKDLAANSATIANLPTYQQVLKPLMDKGVEINDPKQVMDLVGKAVSGGLLDHTTAANDIATIYQMGVKTNLATRQFTSFGLKPSLSYNAQVETSPSALFSKNGVINMTDVNQVSKTLVQVNAQRLASVLAPVFGGVGSLTPYTSRGSNLTNSGNSNSPVFKDQ